MKLPSALLPWSEWLAVLPADLAAPLGELLLRLQPMVGRMAGAAPSPDSTPAGVGGIATRGPYQRLLLSEWALLDAAPDEFLRRAAGGELLFGAPEPQVQRRAHTCVLLFDAGPAQLGEPRLAHLALFILLARRALDAGAELLWGTLQAPHALRSGCASDAAHAMLAARTLARVGAADLAAWNGILKAYDDATEVWQVGAAGAATVERASAQAGIEQDLLDAVLAVSIGQGRPQVRRQLRLALPAPQLGARLLRHRARADAPAPKAPDPGVSDAISPAHAPCFALADNWVAVAGVSGGSMLHAVKRDPYSRSGKPRSYPPLAKGKELGVVLFGKMLGRVVSDGAQLTLLRFPGNPFGHERSVPLPPPDQFVVPAELDGWMPTFFLKEPGASQHVLMLDAAGQLGCWSSVGNRAFPEVRFHRLAERVVGAAQSETCLYYASCDGKETTIHCVSGRMEAPLKMAVHPFRATQVLFGVGPCGWRHAAYSGLNLWLLVGGNGNSVAIEVGAGATAIGIASAGPQRTDGPALLVLDESRCAVELHAQGASRVILRSKVPIAEAVLDLAGERLCWVTGQGELRVIDLHSRATLLDVAPSIPWEAP